MPERKMAWSHWESEFKKLLFQHIGDEINMIYDISLRDYIHELYNNNYNPQKAFDQFILHGKPKTDIIYKY